MKTLLRELENTLNTLSNESQFGMLQVVFSHQYTPLVLTAFPRVGLYSSTLSHQLVCAIASRSLDLLYVLNLSRIEKHLTRQERVAIPRAFSSLAITECNRRP